MVVSMHLNSISSQLLRNHKSASDHERPSTLAASARILPSDYCPGIRMRKEHQHELTNTIRAER
jgi:hypothetical protein